MRGGDGAGSGRTGRLLRCAALGALLLGAAPAGARASWFAGVDGGLLYDDNVSNGAFDEDRLDDLQLFAGGHGGFAWPLTENGRLRLRGTLAYHEYQDWDKLSGGQLGVDVSWRQKVRFGADAPWFDFSVGGALIEDGSDVRGGTTLDAAVRFGHPVSDRWTYVLAAEFLSWDADSEAFTQDALRGSFRADVFLAHEVTLFAEGSFRSGEFTSTATNPGVDPRVNAILDASTALVEDDAFPWPNEAFPRIAYRLEGNTLAAGVGVLKEWGAHALEVSYHYRHTEADDDDVPSYPDNRIRASYLYTF